MKISDSTKGAIIGSVVVGTVVYLAWGYSDMQRQKANYNELVSAGHADPHIGMSPSNFMFPWNLIG